MRRSWLIPFLAGGSAAALLHSLLQTRPIFDSTPQDPAPDYAGALQRMTALTALDTSRVKPACRSRLLTRCTGGAGDCDVPRFSPIARHSLPNWPKRFLPGATTYSYRAFLSMVWNRSLRILVSFRRLIC